MSQAMVVWTAVSRREGLRLAELAEGKRCLEVGSFHGFSTITMARTAEYVVAVDHHLGDWAHDWEEGSLSTLPLFMDNIHASELTNVIPVIARSEQVLPLLAPGSFEFAFIDGNHDYEHAYRDGTLAWPLLASGGVLAFHDYFDGETGHGTVRVLSAVTDLADEWGVAVQAGPDSLATISKP